MMTIKMNVATGIVLTLAGACATASIHTAAAVDTLTKNHAPFICKVSPEAAGAQLRTLEQAYVPGRYELLADDPTFSPEALVGGLACALNEAPDDTFRDAANIACAVAMLRGDSAAISVCATRLEKHGLLEKERGRPASIGNVGVAGVRAILLSLASDDAPKASEDAAPSFVCSDPRFATGNVAQACAALHAFALAMARDEVNATLVSRLDGFIDLLDVHGESDEHASDIVTLGHPAFDNGWGLSRGFSIVVGAIVPTVLKADAAYQQRPTHDAIKAAMETAATKTTVGTTMNVHGGKR